MNAIAEVQKPMTALELREQVNLIQGVMQSVMKKDVHYGVIPGCKAPSLYKPGAEKIMATFRLTPEYQIMDYSTDNEIRYQIITVLKSPSNVKVGEGIGECTSNEDKYKWRGVVCEDEFNNTPEEARRIAYKRKQGGYYTVKQIRTNLADLRNTILKMAKKRSLIDAILTTTAASDIFTQDIEDLPEELLDSVEKNSKPAIYSDSDFQTNLPKWRQLVESKKKTPQQIIAMIGSRYQLTDDQQKTILALDEWLNDYEKESQ